jgi:OOP family OmpA-OmpF porin
MNKLVKIIFAASSAVIAFSATAQTADFKAATPKSAYVQDARGNVLRTSSGQCVRTGYWTPADAVVPGCDGAVAKVAAAPTPAQPAAKPAAPVAKPAPVTEKVTFSADTLFDFNKATLRPEGKEKLDDLFLRLFGMQLEVIIATGHTDQIGSDSYNEKLSLRRAEAVKAYLLEKGVEENRVYTEGKGESNPVVTCTEKNRAALIQCLQPNRRVEVEVVGTRTR